MLRANAKSNIFLLFTLQLRAANRCEFGRPDLPSDAGVYTTLAVGFDPGEGHLQSRRIRRIRRTADDEVRGGSCWAFVYHYRQPPSSRFGRNTVNHNPPFAILFTSE